MLLLVIVPKAIVTSQSNQGLPFLSIVGPRKEVTQHAKSYGYHLCSVTYFLHYMLKSQVALTIKTQGAIPWC